MSWSSCQCTPRKIRLRLFSSTASSSVARIEGPHVARATGELLAVEFVDRRAAKLVGRHREPPAVCMQCMHVMHIFCAAPKLSDVLIGAATGAH